MLILYCLRPVGKISAKSLLLFAAIAVVLAIAGCGGGGDSGSSESTASGAETTSSGKPVQSGDLSKDEFVKQADAICEEGKKQSLEKMSAYMQQHGASGEPTPELVVEAVKAVFIPEVQSQIDEIRALGAPQGDEAKIEAFLDAMEAGAKEAGEATVSSSTQFGHSFKHSADLAREYGLDGCAYG